MPSQKDNSPLSLLEKFLYWAEKKPNVVFLRQPSDRNIREITWGEAASEVKKIATALKSFGLPEGAKVALFSKNCAHWVLTDLAISLSGYVSVPLYPTLNSETINLILDHSEASCIFLGKLDESVVKQLKINRKMLRISFPYQQFDDSHSWDSLLKHEEYSAKPDTNLDKLSTLIYTSGTTGVPKGVMHSVRAIACAATEGCRVMKFDEDERFFSYLPLAHVAERFLVETMGVYCGGTISFANRLETFTKDVTEAKPTLFMAVPRIWQKMQEAVLKKLPQKKLSVLLSIPIVSGVIKRKIRNSLGLSSVVKSITGSAAISKATIEWYAKLGIHIQEAYGMSENFAYSHLNRKNNIVLGSVGQPLPGVELKFTSDGEVLIKSPANMMGYYKEPKMTEEQFVDGYLRTGDRGQQDKHGHLELLGRVKDLFKTSKGKYVAPAPIELELSKSEWIDQVCVVGAGLPQPIALAVLSQSAQSRSASEIKSDFETLLKQTNRCFNNYEHLSSIVLLYEAWSIENGFLTPTLKVKRNMVEKKYDTQLAVWAEGKQKVLQLSS